MQRCSIKPACRILFLENLPTTNGREVTGIPQVCLGALGLGKNAHASMRQLVGKNAHAPVCQLVLLPVNHLASALKG